MATREVWGRHRADERSGIDAIIVAEVASTGAWGGSHEPRATKEGH
ncbi:MAG: hypothetical protein JOZ98_07100 [Solirubrobacterales bacterium]|nr:hypothetical protein [Solirubrobacterales bacterium]